MTGPHCQSGPSGPVGDALALTYSLHSVLMTENACYRAHSTSSCRRRHSYRDDLCAVEPVSRIELSEAEAVDAPWRARAVQKREMVYSCGGPIEKGCRDIPPGRYGPHRVVAATERRAVRLHLDGFVVGHRTSPDATRGASLGHWLRVRFGRRARLVKSCHD